MGIQLLQVFFVPVGKGRTKISIGLGKMVCKPEPPVWSVCWRDLDQVQRMDGQVKQGTVSERVNKCSETREVVIKLSTEQLLALLF